MLRQERELGSDCECLRVSKDQMPSSSVGEVVKTLAQNLYNPPVPPVLIQLLSSSLTHNHYNSKPIPIAAAHMLDASPAPIVRRSNLPRNRPFQNGNSIRE
jgi:hypothetical protein